MSRGTTMSSVAVQPNGEGPTPSELYRIAVDWNRVQYLLAFIAAIPADLRTNTTSTSSGESRKISVTQIVCLLLLAIAIADAVSIGIILF